jgi:predicted DNA-binding transcriptional regulator AlpA
MSALEEDQEVDRPPSLTIKRAPIHRRGDRAEPPLNSSVQSAQERNRSRSRVPNTGIDFERLLTPKEAAHFLRLSLSWLAKARMRGDGPPYVKFGRSVRYRESALVEWMKCRARLSTSQP